MAVGKSIKSGNLKEIVLLFQFSSCCYKRTRGMPQGLWLHTAWDVTAHTAVCNLLLKSTGQQKSRYHRNDMYSLRKIYTVYTDRPKEKHRISSND